MTDSLAVLSFQQLRDKSCTKRLDCFGFGRAILIFSDNDNDSRRRGSRTWNEGRACAILDGFGIVVLDFATECSRACCIFE
jgi:hypothetical protein